MKKCKWCGAELKDNAKSCPKCRTVYDDKSKSNTPNKQVTNNNNDAKYIMIRLAILAVVVIVGVLLVGNSLSNVDTNDSVKCESCGRTFTFENNKHDCRCITYTNMCKKCYSNFCYLNGKEEKDY